MSSVTGVVSPLESSTHVSLVTLFMLLILFGPENVKTTVSDQCSADDLTWGDDVEDPGVCVGVRTVGDVSDRIEGESLSLSTGSSPPHLMAFSCLCPYLVSLPAPTDSTAKYILVESLPWSTGANISSVVTLTWDQDDMSHHETF